MCYNEWIHTNTSMSTRMLTCLRVSLVAALAMTATPAYAYLTPEAVFGSNQSTTVNANAEETHAAASSSSTGFDRTDPAYLPPSQRGAENEAALQQSQRNFQYADIQDIEVHAAAAEDTSPALNRLDEDVNYDYRMQRIAESKQNGNNVTIVIGGDSGGVVTTDGTVLHSAAPRVTATGPESVLAALALLLAAVSTVFYARYRQSTLS